MLGLPVLGPALVLALMVAATGCSHRAADLHRVSAPIGDRHDAVLNVVSGADTITVRSADLGDDLFVASTPDGSRVRPTVDGDHGTVTVHLVDADGTGHVQPDGTITHDGGPGGPATTEILVSNKVRWQLHLDGGTQLTTVDFSTGNLAGLDLSQGSTRIDVSLDSPHGTVPVRISGGASEFDLHAPAGVPAQVRIGGGAGTATIDGAVHSGVSGGTMFTPSGWSTATDRYDIQADAGVSALVLSRTGT
jgi:hypothetical protein